VAVQRGSFVTYTFNTQRITVRGKRGLGFRARWWIAVRLIWLARKISGIEYVD